MKLACLLSSVLLSVAASAAEPGAALDYVVTPRDTLVPFTELRMNALLAEPLEMSGELLYESNGSLSKLIRAPVNETVIITTQSVRIERNGDVRELPLRKARELAEFYAGLRALLDGDFDELRAQFLISDIASAPDWSVNLVPRSARLKKFAPSLIVSGSGSRLLEIQVLRTDDDWQIIRLDSGKS